METLIKNGKRFSRQHIYNRGEVILIKAISHRRHDSDEWLDKTSYNLARDGFPHHLNIG